MNELKSLNQKKLEILSQKNYDLFNSLRHIVICLLLTVCVYFIILFIVYFKDIANYLYVGSKYPIQEFIKFGLNFVFPLLALIVSFIAIYKTIKLNEIQTRLRQSKSRNELNKKLQAGYYSLYKNKIVLESYLKENRISKSPELIQLLKNKIEDIDLLYKNLRVFLDSNLLKVKFSKEDEIVMLEMELAVDTASYTQNATVEVIESVLKSHNVTK